MAMMQKSVTYEVQSLFSRVLAEQNRTRYNEDLWRYYGHLATQKGAIRRVGFVYDLCRLARFSPQGKVILDAGCGFGAIAVILAMMGAKRVIGVDVMEERLSTFARIIEDFGLSGQLEARLTGAEQTGLPDSSVDAVISNEAISHYRDVDGFLREAARILRPGGVILISDGNNAANPWRRRETYAIWERFEKGPAGAIHGHVVSTPYVTMRTQIIRSVAPELEDDVVQMLAERTCYLSRDEVIQAVQLYRSSGVLPQSTFEENRCPINPMTGVVIERLFHPAELVRHIETFGFRARCFAAAGGALPRWLVPANLVFQFLTPITLPIARAFRIVAIRQ